MSSSPPPTANGQKPTEVLLAVLVLMVLVTVMRLGGNRPDNRSLMEGEKILSARLLEWDLNSGWPTSAQFQTIRARPPLTPSQLQVVESAFRMARSGHTYKDHPLSGPRSLWRFTTSAREYHVSFELLSSRDGHTGPWVSIDVKAANDSWFDGSSLYEVESDEARPLIDLLDHLD